MYDVLKEMAQLHASKKKRYENEDAEILKKVSAKLITKETLRQKLAEHVEKVSTQIVWGLNFLMKMFNYKKWLFRHLSNVFWVNVLGTA